MGSMGELTPMQRQLLDTIKTNAERMTAIINDLLDITKIESGSVELEFKPVDVLEAISLSVNRQQPLLEARGHHLKLDVPADLPLLQADQARFGQVLDNLLSNALKYTPKGGKIAIGARALEGDTLPINRRAGLPTRRTYVEITIGDNGIGIASAEHERIWERFFRVESDLKVEAGGTGLGLALVRPLVHLMGGRLWLESEAGNGATFGVLLPAA
jgi:signal transduction histidine kinase